MSGGESDAYELANSASHLLHRAEQLAAERFSVLVAGDVTLRQFAVLAAIAQAPGVSQAELVRHTGVDRSTIAGITARLQKAGLIARADSETDKRANAVTLTADGRQMLQTATKHARAADAAILDALPRSKRKAFLSILMKLAEFADAAAAKAEKDAKRQAKRQRDAARKDAKKKRDAERKQRA